MDVNYSHLFCFKICVMGSASVGKTAIINRIVNNSFPIIYEPTYNVDRYSVLFNLNEYEVRDKTFVMVTLEDMFGINNPLLQTPENLLTSSEQRERRKAMAETFKKIMFTSNEKRNKISEESKKAKKSNNVKDKTQFSVYEKIFNDDPEIERRGFIFVCDCTDPESIKDVTTVIDKLHQIEKSNNLFYPKCILLNKIDKITDKDKLKNLMKDLDQYKAKYKLDTCRVSALTNYGINEFFKKFVSKIHQQEIDNKQNEGLEEPDDDEGGDDRVMCTDKLNSCSKKVFCGTKIFTCGGVRIINIF